MTKTPGETPGSSAFARPLAALGVAAIVFVAFVLALEVLPRSWGGADWLAPTVDAAVKTVLFAGGAVLAARAFGASGIRSSLGLGSLRGIDLVLGAAAGLLLRGIVELVTPTTGSLLGPFDTTVTAATVVSLVVAVAVSPFVEEVLFRGVVQRAVADAVGARIVGQALAVIVATAAFVLLHVLASGASTTPAVIVTTAVTGIGCGILTAYTGQLWAAVAAHTVFNLLGVVLLAV